VNAVPTGTEHVRALYQPLRALEADCDRIDAWGTRLAAVLLGGGRLLVAGNGGSAAQAQHLTAELVGRYRDDRIPLSALALHGDSSSVTAIANDFGYDEVFARQVRAHGRPGDILLVLSTSGRSPSCLCAVEAAQTMGMVAWGVTGPAGNPLAELADDAITVDAPATATVQEVHQVVVHLLCARVDALAHASRDVVLPAEALA